MEELYNSNADFKRYVDRYCNMYRHRVSVEEALRHKLVQAAGEYYMKKDVDPDKKQ